MYMSPNAIWPFVKKTPYYNSYQVLRLLFRCGRLILLRPHNPRICCARSIGGVVWSLPRWIYYAFVCSLSFHHPPPHCRRSRRYRNRNLEYIQLWPTPLLFIFFWCVIVMVNKLNIYYLNTCIGFQLVRGDIKWTFAI